MAIRIAFTNIKGGIGKTTSSVALSVGLAQRGYRVLLVDGDPQGSASSNLGRKDIARYSLADCFDGIHVTRVIRDTEIKNLDIIPSNLNLLNTIKYLEKSERRVDNLLNSIIDEVDSEYDFIVFDCLAFDNILLTNLYVAAQYLVVPVKLDKHSLEGYDYLLNKIEIVRADLNNDLEIIGVLPTMYRHTNLHREVLESLKKSAVGELLFDTYIRTSIRVEEAPFYSESILQYAKNSTSAIDYNSFIDELLEALDLA